MNNDGVDEAFAVYLRMCDDGQITSREEFLKQFPQQADSLRELMDAADLLGSFTASRAVAGDSSIDPDESDDNPAATSLATGDTPTVLQPVRLAADRLPDWSTDGFEDLPAGPDARPDHGGPTLPCDLGDYRLLRVLGIGGMGVVYLARQRDLDRLVAIKMIRGGLLATGEEVRRFYTEAQAAARLRHPGIVPVHQFGQADGHHYFSMAYVEGDDLAKILRSGPLPAKRAARIVRDVAEAIAHAHQRGVLHRDLKPANVLIDLQDAVHVTDFGLAKHLDGDSSVTGSGRAIGTPHYMAPEQATGHSEHATAETDVYALGAVLFAALTGRPPIVGDTVMQTLMRVVHTEAPSLRSVLPDSDPDLEAITHKCLEKRPADRYPNAAAMADDLDRYLAGRVVKARVRSRWRRSWEWFAGIPMVAALVDRRSHEPTAGQRRLQRLAIAAVIGLPLLLFTGLAVRRHRAGRMPPVVRIAGGPAGGTYIATAATLGKMVRRETDGSPVPIEIVASGGSGINRQLLINQKVHLAPMQAFAIGGEVVRVITPLYYETVYLLARGGGAFDRESLSGRRVAIGPQGGGSAPIAQMVLDSLDLPPTVVARDFRDWPAVRRPDSGVDHAIVCMNQHAELIDQWLADPDWQPVSLDASMNLSLEHPTLRPIDYISRGNRLIHAVGTTAFLCGRTDTPDVLVTTVLSHLHRDLPPGWIAPASVAEWRGLAFHPAAQRYFEAIRADDSP